MVREVRRLSTHLTPSVIVLRDDCAWLAIRPEHEGGISTPASLSRWSLASGTQLDSMPIGEA